jgi:hypothetical protein
MVVSKEWIGPRWGVFLASVSVSALVVGLLLQAYRSGRADQPPSLAVREIPLGRARPDSLYALTIWVKNPAQLQRDAVLATVRDARGQVGTKWLHAADLDFYLTLHPRAEGQVTVTLSAPARVSIPDISAAMHPVPVAPTPGAGRRAPRRPASSLPRPTIAGKPLSPSNSGRPFMAVTMRGRMRPPQAKMATRRCSTVFSGSNSSLTRRRRD